MNSNKKHSNKTLRYIVPAIIIFAVIALFVYSKYTNESTRNNLAVNHQETAPPETSKPTTHSSTSSTNPTPGGTVDLNGQSSNSLPPSSDWVASASGKITLQSPSPNTAVKSGDVIEGLASVSSVNYTLTDSNIGLIDQGNLSVVNGKFAGKLEFSTQSSNGKLEVYYPNPANGAEEDLVEINVNFSN